MDTPVSQQVIDAFIAKAQRAEARGQIKAAARHWAHVGRLLAVAA
jgi:hypothetical protein